MVSRVQASMYAFVGFTVVQILVFLFQPGFYEALAPGLCAAPKYVALRLIGLKEIGLMAMYLVGTANEDLTVIKATIAGRLSVILYTSYIVFHLGVPTYFLFGILQDVSFGLWTLREVLYYERKSTIGEPAAYLQPLDSSWKQATKIVIFLAGFCEFGAAAFNFNLLSQAESSLLRENVGLLSYEYMSSLVGSYQMYFACTDVHHLIYLAVGIHHLLYFLNRSDVTGMLTMLGIQEEATTLRFHLYFGCLIILLVGFNHINALLRKPQHLKLH
mmetsp:Transcript_13844/g.15779  ORF Transcript_13844/g.15779 Transcript_13844/m.15779 type:complete len:273 (+) Transcript_13844:152-970(+)